MADLDTKKIRACSPFLVEPAPGVVTQLCDEIGTLRARVAELEAKLKVAEEALTRVSSVEALHISRALDAEHDRELIARMEYAGAALAKIKEAS